MLNSPQKSSFLRFIISHVFNPRYGISEITNTIEAETKNSHKSSESSDEKTMLELSEVLKDNKDFIRPFIKSISQNIQLAKITYSILTPFRIADVYSDKFRSTVGEYIINTHENKKFRNIIVVILCLCKFSISFPENDLNLLSCEMLELIVHKLSSVPLKICRENKTILFVLRRFIVTSIVINLTHYLSLRPFKDALSLYKAL